MMRFKSITLILMIHLSLCICNLFAQTIDHTDQGEGTDKDQINFSEDLVLGPLFQERNISTLGFKQLCPKFNEKFHLNQSCFWYIACGRGYLTIHHCSNHTVFDGSTCNQNLAVDCHTSQLEPSLPTILDFVSLHKPSILIQMHPTGEKQMKDGPWRNTAKNEISATMENKMYKDKNKRENTIYDVKNVPFDSNALSSPATHEISSTSVSLLKDSLPFIKQKPKPRSPTKTAIEYPKGQVSKAFSICANETTGVFKHYMNSCHNFIECVSGKAFLRKCASGTTFNPSKFACDAEHNVDHCGTGTGGWEKFPPKPEPKTTNPANKQVMKSLTDLPQVEIQVEGNEISLKESTGSESSGGSWSQLSQLSLRRRRRDLNVDVDTDMIVQTRRKCQATDDYIQPHAVYCNKFEICSNGKITEKTCGLGAMFNPLSLVCDFPYNVDCESRRVDFASYDCQPEHKYRASHPENCDQFIECDRGNLHIKTCPPSTLYNYEEEECDHVYRVKCKKPISLEHDTESEPNYNHIRRRRQAGASRNHGLNLDCRRKVTGNYIAPHPIYCNKFVECEDDRIFVKDCGPGTVYNREIGQCDWAYNTRLPDPNDCSQYLQCERGRYTPQRCLGNTVFSRQTRRCVFSRSGNDDCRQFPPIIPQLS